MSRVGKMPIPIPSGVKISVLESQVRVQGPRGTMSTAVPRGITAAVENGELRVRRGGDDKTSRALHGLARSLLANSVTGVTQGFRKELDIVGIGFRAELRGKILILSLGFSHTIDFPVPEGINIRVERAGRQIQNYVTTILVEGVDKYRVGQVAANIRALKRPDAYKGKGIRYRNEQIHLKVGKKGA